MVVQFPNQYFPIDLWVPIFSCTKDGETPFQHCLCELSRLLWRWFQEYGSKTRLLGYMVVINFRICRWVLYLGDRCAFLQIWLALALLMSPYSCNFSNPDNALVFVARSSWKVWIRTLYFEINSLSASIRRLVDHSSSLIFAKLTVILFSSCKLVRKLLIPNLSCQLTSKIHILERDNLNIYLKTNESCKIIVGTLMFEAL